jgi:Transglycosylase SLT domain
MLAGLAASGGPLGAKLAALIAAACLACLVALFCFLALFGALLGGPAAGATVACGVSAAGRGEIPARLVPIYQRASSRYRLGERGVPILAAINKIESGFGRNMGPSSAGAVGWMQFMPATWRAWGVDADGDGTRDPADPDDAIHAAARYLHASGAPKDWYRAVFAYNHVDWYVQEVLAQADRYQGACTLTGEGEPAVSLGRLDFRDTSGAWGGSKKFAKALARLGRRYGCTPTSEKRQRKYTDSGGISDHWVGSRTAYAVDLDSGSCTMAHPGGDADHTARAIAAALGMPRHTGIVNLVRGAYRFQLLWQAAGHYDHVHIGVRRVAG